MALCDKPEAVVVEKVETTSTVVFDVTVDPSDVGKAIGKGGGYAFAIRQLFDAIYGRLGKKCHFMVANPQRGTGRRRQ